MLCFSSRCRYVPYFVLASRDSLTTNDSDGGSGIPPKDWHEMTLKFMPSNSDQWGDDIVAKRSSKDSGYALHIATRCVKIFWKHTIWPSIHLFLSPCLFATLSVAFEQNAEQYIVVYVL